MARGTVKSPFNDKGFAFASSEGDDATDDVFLHASHLASGEEASSYVRGATVEFDLVMVADHQGSERPQGRNIRLVRQTVGSTEATTGATRVGIVKFWNAQGFGFIADEESGEDRFVHKSSLSGGHLRTGDVVQFAPQETAKGPGATNVSVIGWGPSGDPFEDLLDLGSPSWAKRLAELAEPENWNYQVKPTNDPFTILRSYVKYTFLRLNELQDHVLTSADGDRLSFNTGLVTPFQEQIFALFRARPAEAVGPPWVLTGFEKSSSMAMLSSFGGNPPPLAWYYKEPKDLIFEWKLKLEVNVEHVPHDRDRFPDALKSLSSKDLASQVKKAAPAAVERVKRNYKTAIPQFYRDGNSGQAKMQLLLPISLMSQDKVELALAVDRLESDVYLGRTVLALDWAYNNARLLTRPDTDWLRP